MRPSACVETRKVKLDKTHDGPGAARAAGATGRTSWWSTLVHGGLEWRALPLPRTLPGWLRVLGPAWIVMLADVDAPSVLTAAQAGSQFGYEILFVLVALIPVLYLMQEMTARLGTVTGLGHGELIRERYGSRWSGIAVLSMVAIDLVAYTAEFAGIALGASLIGISPTIAVVAALVLHSIVVLTGGYRSFERMVLVLSLALFVFVPLAFVQRPDPAGVLAGLSPLPAHPSGEFLGLVVANIGASVMPWMLFYQQAATVDKGLGPGELPAARRETLVGAVVSQGLMVAVVIAAAAASRGTLPAGVPAQVPAGLAALAANGMAWIVAVGLIGAGLLAAVVISLSSAWAWCEWLGWPHSLNLSFRRAPGFYAVYLLEVVPAAIVALASRQLVTLVLDAMILNVVALVVPLFFLVRLSSDREVLGERANSPLRAAVLWIVTGVVLVLGCLGLVSVVLGA